jgi:hypothetical protein
MIRARSAIFTSLIVLFFFSLIDGSSHSRSLAPASVPSQKDESSGAASSALDFEAYRTQVEPIFLKRREGGEK